MEKIAYLCKFCGKQGVAEYDPQCPPLKLEIWKSWLACDRCADFHAARIKLEYRINRACGDLLAMNNARQEAMKEENEKEQKARESIRSGLVFLTKRYAVLICAFYRKVLTWEPDFPAMLADRPDKAGFIINKYHQDMNHK